jgi:putative flippase GtrA
MTSPRAASPLIALFLSARFLRFLVFGGLAAVVNLAVGALLYSNQRVMAVVPYWVTVATGATCGLLVNFALNYAYNFRYYGRGTLSQFRTFLAVTLVGVGLTALAANLFLMLATAIGVPPVVRIGSFDVTTTFASHVFAVGLVTFYSYTCHSLFTFNEGLRSGLKKLLPRLSRVRSPSRGSRPAVLAGSSVEIEEANKEDGAGRGRGAP